MSVSIIRHTSQRRWQARLWKWLGPPPPPPRRYFSSRHWPAASLPIGRNGRRRRPVSNQFIR